MLGAIWDVLFPARCLGCRRRGVMLCEPCRHELPILRDGVCRRCGGLRTGMRQCRGCQTLAPALDSVRAVCAYEGAARQAVHTLKYRTGRNLAPLMGSLMREHLARRPLHADLVIPVPLAAGRRRDRGYNQAALLAEQIVDVVRGTLAEDVLERRDRPPQHTLRAHQRKLNVQHAITARRLLAGERVLLVDDVATTCATLSACADALAEANAGRITALVFARDL